MRRPLNNSTLLHLPGSQFVFSPSQPRTRTLTVLWTRKWESCANVRTGVERSLPLPLSLLTGKDPIPDSSGSEKRGPSYVLMVPKTVIRGVVSEGPVKERVNRPLVGLTFFLSLKLNLTTLIVKCLLSCYFFRIV